MKIITIYLASQLIFTQAPNKESIDNLIQIHEHKSKIVELLEGNQSPHIEYEFPATVSGSVYNPMISWDGSSGPWFVKSGFNM